MSLSQKIIRQLVSLRNQEGVQGMSRFGIKTDKALGIRIPVLRAIAKEHKLNHDLALELWQSGYHEARILASMVDNPKEVTPQQMDQWTNDFASWDLCDQVCINLFTRTNIFHDKILEYSQHPSEFVKRSAFSMIASHAVKDKSSNNDHFLEFFPIIQEASSDPRNYVKKAVNWALRQIGKRNSDLAAKTLEFCKSLRTHSPPTSAWIASDAIRELSKKFPSLN